MAKNTGRYSRAANVNRNGNMWVRRKDTTGLFIKAKTNGGAFGNHKLSFVQRFLNL